MIMERVAVTFTVSNVNMESKQNIWQLIERFEKTKTDFGVTRVVDEESKFISDSSAVLVFDMSSSKPCEEIATCELSDGQVIQVQKLMEETTTVKMQGPLFNNRSLNKSKLQVFAHRLQVNLNINDETLQITGTWHAIAQFRKKLSEEISDFLKTTVQKDQKHDSAHASSGNTQKQQKQGTVFNDASSTDKGVIQMGSLSNDVLALMKKSGTYKHDHLTYDPEGGRVIIQCPGDEETASTIAEAFQAQYSQILMGGILKEYSFPIFNIDNRQKVDKLVKQFNTDYPQSVFKFDQENKVIKCLSMNARQMARIKAKVKDLLEKPDAPTASASVADTRTSMSMTLPGGRRVTLKQANIVEETVDVIVNAANDKLNHIGGVAAAINKASHNMVQLYSTNLLQQQHGGGPLATGQAVCTAAGGALKCKHVIHTIGPEAYKHGNQCQHLLWTACMNTLQLAEKLKVTSLAIPPISTGIFRVPKDLVAKTLIQTVCSYPGYTEGVLRDIRIVIIDKETYEAFKPSFIDMRTNWNAGVATTQPPMPLQHSHSWPNGDRANNPPVSHKDEYILHETKELCPVCQGNIDDPVVTTCQHKYCRGCLTRSLHASPYCLVCNKQLQEITGNQPDGGKMSHQILTSSLPGHERYNTIKITYSIPSGVQGPNHPHPGQQFIGNTLYAYLPDSPEGKVVLTLLKKAFDAKLLFTIGKSATFKTGNTVVWSDIQQKSSRYGGPQYYGYPDPDYLIRVREQLRQKGIIEGQML